MSFLNGRKESCQGLKQVGLLDAVVGRSLEDQTGHRAIVLTRFHSNLEGEHPGIQIDKGLFDVYIPLDESLREYLS
ncbi:hypothetical protein TNCV_5019271 [Trichonephila clavipes]|nr:hypothetical protein TNCV_5019271 [Trichonephila clavipes]